MSGVDVQFLAVQWKDHNGRWHEQFLHEPDGTSTYDGLDVCNDRYGWIDCGRKSFCFDPEWPVLIVRGRLSDEFGREYFEEHILQEGE